MYRFLFQYYFGDFNMMRDKFLKHEITKDEGWVAITTLLRFNRLAALTKNVADVINVFKNNESSICEVRFPSAFRDLFVIQAY